MRKESRKLYISTIAQVPICLALLALACVQLCCSYMESRLRRLLCRLTRQALFEKKNQKANVFHRSHNTVSHISASSDDIDSLMSRLSTQEADCIEWVRMAYDTRAMREVVGLHPNRKLYAVLRPTKTENLQRVEWMLRAWPNQYSHWLVDAIKSAAVGFEMLRPKPLCKNDALPVRN